MRSWHRVASWPYESPFAEPGECVVLAVFEGDREVCLCISNEINGRHFNKRMIPLRRLDDLARAISVARGVHEVRAAAQTERAGTRTAAGDGQ